MIVIGAIVLVPHLLVKNTTSESGFAVRIIDGDTFELFTGEKVRLICVNTPERDEEGYGEAKNFLTTLVMNKTVLLEKDVSERDKFGRLLRYVYLNESWELIFLNKMLVQQGFAEVKRYTPDTQRCDEITAP